MNLKEHPINEKFGECICYRMRTQDEQWIGINGKVSMPFKRGAKNLRVFYPTKPDEAPFYVSVFPYDYRRGLVWAMKSDLDVNEIVDVFVDHKTYDMDEAYELLRTLVRQISFLEMERKNVKS